MNLSELKREIKEHCNKINLEYGTYARGHHKYDGMTISYMQKHCIELKDLAVDFILDNPKHLNEDGVEYLFNMTAPGTVDGCIKFKNTVQLLLLYKVKYNEKFIGSENFHLF